MLSSITLYDENTHNAHKKRLIYFIVLIPVPWAGADFSFDI